MEIKIERQAEQPLMSRTVMEGRLSFEAATPGRADVRKKIAEAAKADEELVHVPMIKTDFGQRAASVTAHVYKSKDALEKYSSIKARNRHLSKEEKEKMKAAKPAEGA